MWFLEETKSSKKDKFKFLVIFPLLSYTDLRNRNRVVSEVSFWEE